MKTATLHFKRTSNTLLHGFYVSFFALLNSCNGQHPVSQPTIKETPAVSKPATNDFNFNIDLNKKEYISEFVRRIFEDSKGNLWMGTNGDGVARYDGKSLTYYNRDNGFCGNAVRGIVEDKAGIIWFATENGLCSYNGTSFINFTEKDGLPDRNLWSVYLDTNGLLWMASLQGACTYDGKKFTPFVLPESAYDNNRGVSSKKIVHSITQDHAGTMWLGTGNGAYTYDGKTLNNISVKDGLPSNSVNDILEDTDHNLWFATHYEGVSRYDGKTFTNYMKNGTLQGTEVWSLFKDASGAIWFPVEHHGVYRYNGTSFKNYTQKDGLDSNAIQDIYQDKKGTIWAGGHTGLYRFENERFTAVSRFGILENN